MTLAKILVSKAGKKFSRNSKWKGLTRQKYKRKTWSLHAEPKW